MKRFGRFFKRQWQTKTGCSAILGIIGAGVSVATGTLPLSAAVVVAYGALQTMFLRDRGLVKDMAEAERKEQETGGKPLSAGG